jgi:hypothetical protein
MIAALLEWFLWVAAFLYCLVKVYQKAETLSIKILAIVMMFAFTGLRYVFAIIRSNYLSLTINQMYILAYHGRNASTSRPDHQILSSRNGQLFAMVRVLVFLWTLDRTMAHLRISTCHSLCWKD